jgi:hypothetical protein
MNVRLLIAAALFALPFPAAAQWWDSEAPGRMMFAGQYQRTDIDRARVEVQRAVHAGDIDKLERMHEEFLRLQKAAGPGRFMMAAFNDTAELAGRDRPRLAQMLARWKQERPSSALRPAIEAAAWMHEAWSHRGSGYANTVSPEAMKLFQAALDRGARVLQEAGPEARTTPLYFSQAVAIAGAGGAPARVLDALFEDGVARFPIDWSLHHFRLNFLQPQWGGSYEDMERFIRAAVGRTQHSEGTGMYARLWLAMVRSLPQQKDFFGTTKADWRVMRHAFEDAIALDDTPAFRNIARRCGGCLRASASAPTSAAWGASRLPTPAWKWRGTAGDAIAARGRRAARGGRPRCIGADARRFLRGRARDPGRVRRGAVRPAAGVARPQSGAAQR